MEIIMHPNYQNLKAEIGDVQQWVHEKGEVFYEGRNSLAKVILDSGEELAVKSFRIPHFINRIAYGYLRKGKANKSYYNALQLLEKGIKTPAPVAFAQEKGILGLGRSFYVSEYIQYDYLFRDLIVDDTIPNRENLIRDTALFTLFMQDQGVHFKDHSSGNTLLVKSGTDYDFFLVDINRITFKILDLNERFENFSRLTNQPWAIEILAKEAAKHLKLPEQDVYHQILKRALKDTRRRKKRKKIKDTFKYKP